jgi:heat shock protein HtpX
VRSFRSIAWLIATNFAVVLLLGLVTHALGVDAIFHRATGLRWEALLVGAAVFGFGGAFVSLLISKHVAKWSTGARVIDPNTVDPYERHLLGVVERLASRARIPMPEVAIYEGEEANAFATGPSKKRALVAVSTGLLHRLDDREVEAVLAHEVAHVANGDMLTMTLLQGVLNTFVIALARVAGIVGDQLLRGSRDDGEGERGPSIAYFVVSIAAQLVLGLFASMIAAAFSRRREFRADADAARLVGAQAMISALARLHEGPDDTELPKPVASLGLRGRSFFALLSTHPPLEARVAALQAMDRGGAAAPPGILSAPTAHS